MHVKTVSFRIPSLISIVVALSLNNHGTSAYLTLKDMYEITNLTVEATGRIRGGGVELIDLGNVGLGLGGRGSSGEQRVLVVGTREDRREEAEDDVTASLSMVNKAILEYLNTPEPKFPASQGPTICTSVTKNYYSFLEKTTLFLRAVEDTQITWRWDGNSPVFDSLGYLQALWASRRPNKQNRSFIEQQMALYSSTGCFSGKGNEVLRRDVEVVEYMNDLLDSFQ